MDAQNEESGGSPAKRNVFRALRKSNQRRARIAALLEERRERHLRIERVVQTQRVHRQRHGG
jgi:hypothetical protein